MENVVEVEVEVEKGNSAVKWSRLESSCWRTDRQMAS